MLELIQQLAELRFAKVKDSKARHHPYRVFDRILDKTIAKFESEVDADNFRSSTIATFVKEKSDAFLPKAVLHVNANG